MITHSNFASAIRYQQKALGFHSKARVYDFVAYSFDVAWSNMLHTLTAGGESLRHQIQESLADNFV